MDEKRILPSAALEQVTGGESEEQYYAEYAKFGLIDTEEHLLQGKTCTDCNYGKLTFWRYQPGPFGNKEAVYYCNTCHEYTLAALRKD